MSTSATPATNNPILKSHLRITRPTNSISSVLPFYTDGLGFQIIGSFEKHAGFDGIMLGHPKLSYHLEFTAQEGHDAGRAPTQDNLLVFYLPEVEEWKDAVGRMEKAGFEAVKSWNPYWDAHGKGRTFEDVDGYRIVFWNEPWGT
ncbi:Glyoxalase/Bleomycin resistance protein/Dihydroxybiphenyl dioxygenase [Zopfia rhizophila CBS 207.26]|uniref:Glyoxalase/Bleomycin resistance protein/Dihydroxybiphenyl dioxygenase n=1 Tax=Zopfia rhizophila CBS 207.26 TaxID=1314779 RepID=A0A6A6EYP9_9PEZI|nr:Glyoxalase/Bleomycin resistance protein/Dihydroxybiphenyl dioxygenase [Zopfia rhizophila CBS 207.26]